MGRREWIEDVLMIEKGRNKSRDQSRKLDEPKVKSGNACAKVADGLNDM